jgi:lipoprotein-anchoring transpeptidase ErfK/SrfK
VYVALKTQIAWLLIAGLAAAPTRVVGADSRANPVLELQVRLDRAGFSPGQIDGHRGLNTTRAVDAFATSHHLRSGDAAAVTRELARDDARVLTTYTITNADVSGPFTPDIPDDLMAQAALPSLNYRSLDEEIAERFHVSPALLKALNPGVALEEGAEIQVPNVRVLDESAAPSARAAKVVVSKSHSSATAYDAEGRILFYAPVTSGSTHDPLPIGHWTVKGVDRHPAFHYNPDLFWDADSTQSKATIAAGPNNPVGIVWIDISKEHYGLHGTPEPSLIGHTTSHGCVRLTNWDAWRLASLVKTGTPVIFEP